MANVDVIGCLRTSDRKLVFVDANCSSVVLPACKNAAGELWVYHASCDGVGGSDGWFRVCRNASGQMQITIPDDCCGGYAPGDCRDFHLTYYVSFKTYPPVAVIWDSFVDGWCTWKAEFYICDLPGYKTNLSIYAGSGLYSTSYYNMDGSAGRTAGCVNCGSFDPEASNISDSDWGWNFPYGCGGPSFPDAGELTVTP